MRFLNCLLLLSVLCLPIFGCSQKKTSQTAQENKTPERTFVPPDSASESVSLPIGRVEAPDSVSAAAVLDAYYEAINQKNYPRAYTLWGSNGEASGKTLAQFTAGFAKTDSVSIKIGPAGPIEGAAGSRYVNIPVTIAARLSDGTQQHFTGTYTLRRSVVDGATPEQRSWRIYTAHISKADHMN